MDFLAPQGEYEVQHWRATPGQRCNHPASRILPEEVPVALTYGRATHAVMMATPQDLEDFAYGFSLTEGIIGAPTEMAGLEIVRRPTGIELRMELVDARQEALAQRRRHMAGPVGCGLCGLDSLEAVLRRLPVVKDNTQVSAAVLDRAMAALNEGQRLHQVTHAVHAAGFWRQADGSVLVREDVGRHNALDKLGGALLRQTAEARGGAVLLTSRVSVEMVQKTAMLGAPILVAVSAPTALAVRTARAAGITLIARARQGSFDVHSCPWRVAGASAQA